MRSGQYQNSLAKLSRLPPDIQRAAQQLSIACADYAGLGDRSHADETSRELLTSSDFSEADAEDILPTLAAAKRDDLIIAFFEKLQIRAELSPPNLRDLGLAYERAGRFFAARSTMEKFVQKGNQDCARAAGLSGFFGLSRSRSGP